MTSTDAARLIRNPDAPKRATLLELLFDVVYVAAFALLSTRLAADLTWSGVGRTLLLLMAVWWIWAITALLADFYDPQQKEIQLVITSTMLGVVLMAIAIPSAFSTHAPVFAGAYVGLHLVRGILLVALLRGHHSRIRAARFLFWFVMSGFVWIAGAFVDRPVRAGLWGVAIAVDYLVGAFRYPTPRLGRIPIEQYEQASGHLVERYQQVIILALGELILIPALTLVSHDFTPARFTAYLVAFLITLLLWECYIYSVEEIAKVLAAGGTTQGRGSRLAPFTHFLMVAGVVTTAAGSQLVVTQPTGHTPIGWACVILGGAALFVLSRTIFMYAVLNRFATSRVGWLVLLVAAVPAMAPLPPVCVSAVTAAILLALDVTDRLPNRRARS